MTAALTPDQAALVEQARPYARSLAKRGARNGEASDLEQAAILNGAIPASRKYDPARGVKWITYVHHWLEGAIKAESRSLHAHSGALSLDHDENGSFRETVAAGLEPEDESVGPGEALTDAYTKLAAAESAFDRIYEARDKARVCRCGCGQSLAGRPGQARWERDAHRSDARRRERAELDPIRGRIAAIKGANERERPRHCLCKRPIPAADFEGEPSCAKCGRPQDIEQDRGRIAEPSRGVERLMQLDSDGSSLVRKPRPVMARPWRGERDRTGCARSGDAANVAQAAACAKRDVRRGGTYSPGRSAPMWEAVYRCETTWRDIEEALALDAERRAQR